MSKAKVVSWPEWAKWVGKQLEGHQQKIAQIEGLTSRVTALEREMAPIRRARAKTDILKLLRNEDKSRSRRWIQSRVDVSIYQPLSELESEGLVVVTRSGSHTMYAAKEEIKQQIGRPFWNE